MTIRAHASAIKARLEEDAVLAGSTFQGVVINRPARYVSFNLTSGRRVQDRYTGPSSRADFSLNVIAVGSTSEQAQLVAERVLEQLVDFTPTVAGRRCNRLVHDVSLPMNLDRDANPPLHYFVNEFTLSSFPA